MRRTVAMGTELSRVSIGRDTVTGPGVGVVVGVPVAVAVAVTVAVAVAVAVAVGAGVPVCVIVMRPLFWPGTCVFRSPSMKIKLSGSAAQVSGVLAPGVLLTLSILRL